MPNIFSTAWLSFPKAPDGAKVKDISCITTIYAKSLDALGSNGGAIAGPTVECLMKTPQKGALMRR